jgi:uncharacterized LabA/DUF88 family protein
MQFNTVILYDLENLLKGYGFSPKLLQELSLKTIMKEIEATKGIHKVAIQRAYANWGDSRLGTLKTEMLELGIDPIHIFGVSGQNKNIADIQLAIDAMDIMHTKPFIDVFVIVSGDGGFASLVKKLHEYGKTVVGCAYKKTTNKVFKNVCDHFVGIEDPEGELRDDYFKNNHHNHHATSEIVVVGDPRSRKIIHRLRPLDAHHCTKEDLLHKLQEIIKTIQSDADWQQDLKYGLSPTPFKEIFTALIHGFDTLKFGFSKFIEFLRFACKNSDLAVYSMPPSDVKIGLRKHPIRNHDLLPDLEERETHSIECYRSILHSKTNGLFKMPTMGELAVTCLAIQNAPIKNETIADAIVKITNCTAIAVSPEAVKLTILSLMTANVITKDNTELLPMTEQKISLSPDFPTQELMMKHLFEQAAAKITAIIGEEARKEIIAASLNVVG